MLLTLLGGGLPEQLGARKTSYVDVFYQIHPFSKNTKAIEKPNSSDICVQSWCKTAVRNLCGQINNSTMCSARAHSCVINSYLPCNVLIVKE